MRSLVQEHLAESFRIDPTKPKRREKIYWTIKACPNRFEVPPKGKTEALFRAEKLVSFAVETKGGADSEG
jgi:hypothetical protein